MSCYGSCCSLFLLLAFLASLRSSSAQNQNPTYLNHVCLNSTTYSRNSTYFSNLKTLFSSLSSNPFFSNRFYTTAAGQIPDVVYGLFLCRGDISPEFCRECVGFATNDTLSRCPERKAGLLWYEECMIRYADRNIFMDTSFRNGTNGILSWNSQKVSQGLSDRFRDSVFSLMNKNAAEAANSPTRFAVNKSDITSNITLYGLVQCTPDLARQDCSTCLQTAINQLPTDQIGGRLLMPSCSSRYEVYQFYNETVTSTPLPRPGKGGKTSVIIIVVVVVIAALFLLFVLVYKLRAKRRKKMYESELLATDRDDITAVGSLQFDFKAIKAATDKFANFNKLGQGGFGQVYKGTFPSGVQVAVKRLSATSSGQGEKEFENEVVVVAKLQHKNLVKLLGFCMEGDEKILVYEYVPNKSLDYFLFDSMMRRQLEWTRRYKIIGGIARGILYLHQDSRLTIIHRDLKAGNILLDDDMNP